MSAKPLVAALLLAISSGAAAIDMVYNPVETPLIRMAREKGIAVVPGYEMFVHQGARQFEIWTGKPAPEAEMRRVVLHALQQQQTAEVAKTA